MSDLFPVSADPGVFQGIPSVIKERGRVAGFEAMRDKLLDGWEFFIEKGIAPYAALKLVIEVDRHAMFAEVQTAKSRKDEDMEKYAEFQRYLQGKIELPMGDSVEQEIENDGESHGG